MSNEPIFRAATLEDIDAVVSLINGAYRGQSSKSGWTTEADLLEGARTHAGDVASMIAADDSMIVLAEDGGALVGCFYLRRESVAAYLGLLVVRPDLQARGLGKRLMAHAEQIAHDQWNCTEIWMTVISVRAELLAFYGRRGYRRTGEMTPFPTDALSTPRVAGLQFERLVKTLPA